MRKLLKIKKQINNTFRYSYHKFNSAEHISQRPTPLKLVAGSTKAQLSAVTYSNRLSSDIKKGIAITETLKQILIGEEGSDINEFYTIAVNLKRDYRSSF